MGKNLPRAITMKNYVTDIITTEKNHVESSQTLWRLIVG